jgi:hypothetical protein
MVDGRWEIVLYTHSPLVPSVVEVATAEVSRSITLSPFPQSLSSNLVSMTDRAVT